MKRDVLEIEADPLIDARETLDREGIETAVFGSVLHATVENGETAIPRIQTVLKNTHITVSRVEKIVPSLEDVFVTLIESA
jgi:ABC-2 type transport system ATP-binding protein